MSELVELNDRTLIDMLLDEQRQVATPVGRLAEMVEASPRTVSGFQRLVPLTAPKAGEQYAFEVRLDRCSGCKGCVTACHSMNGLDEGETWRDVGLLVGGEGRRAVQQTVTSACHHCVEPACLQGCPVKAYEKDPISGIVMHLDDQCIGCQYCVLKCPYDVPKYSEKRGIVRKCDMCHSRLSVGEAPACVQACPHEAIRIVTVETARSVEAARSEEGFLPGAPKSDYTVPTTRYVSERRLPRGLKAADAEALRPQHAHWPLVAMLSLTQIGVGGFIMSALAMPNLAVANQGAMLGLSWAFLHAGLACSVLHLGKPLKAWRVFLGLGTSWLSREAVIFGSVSALANVALVAFLAEGGMRFGSLATYLPEARSAAVAVSVLGLLGVFSSAYIYIDTRRSFWRPSHSLGKFFGSTLAGALAIGMLEPPWPGGSVAFANGLALVGFAKLAFEYATLRNAPARMRLIKGPLAGLWNGRLMLGFAAYGMAPAFYLIGSAQWGAVSAVALVALSEMAERALYFKGVDAPKMPGGVAL